MLYSQGFGEFALLEAPNKSRIPPPQINTHANRPAPGPRYPSEVKGPRQGSRIRPAMLLNNEGHLTIRAFFPLFSEWGPNKQSAQQRVDNLTS